MRFLNALKNQWLVSRAWMTTSFVFMGVSLFLVVKVSSMAFQIPVRLVPYEFAANNGFVTVKSDGFGDKSKYITDIAIADISNYGSWTSRTIERQYSRFVNRMHPSLYASAGRQLLETAKNKKESEESQVFFIDRTSYSDNKVNITGSLRMYQGINVTRELRMSYTLTYSSLNGLPTIIDFVAKPEKD